MPASFPEFAATPKHPKRFYPATFHPIQGSDIAINQRFHGKTSIFPLERSQRKAGSGAFQRQAAQDNDARAISRIK